MKVSEKQLQALYLIAMDSTRVNVVGDYFSFSIAQRTNLVNDITNQQSDELLDIDDKEPTIEPQYYKESKKAEEVKLV